MKEFSRVINIRQIPFKKPVLCRLIAKGDELLSISHRTNMNLSELSAMVTLKWKDQQSILVTGKLKIKHNDTDEHAVESDFETMLLYNGDKSDIEKLKIEDEYDYDDEVQPDGSIDIGEIVIQYLQLEF